MEEFGVKPDVITFSTIMNAWSAAGYMIKCREIFDDMVEAGIKPDAHAYSILAKGYVRAQEPEKAEELLDTMKRSGVRQNVVIFTTVISGWCSSGSMDSAMRVLEKMIESGISPNLKTFETIIGGYAENKKPWKAEEVLQLMEGFNVRPERSSFQLVAEAWRAIGLTKEANRITGTLRKKTTAHDPSDTQHEAAVESLEKFYQKEAANSSFTRLQIPNVVVSDQKGSAAPTKRSRMVLREAEPSSEGPCPAKALTLTCKFVERAPTVSRRRFQWQPGVYGQFAPLCTVPLLN